VGYFSQNELPYYYALTRVFLFPTLLDPWGVVANEACAAGVPVITCSNAGAAGDLTGLFWTKRFDRNCLGKEEGHAEERFSAEQIVTLLRQIEVSMAQGKSIGVACREAGISDQSYYRWRREYGGLDLDQARRMKELEKENARLRRLVADLSLEKQVLKDISSGNL
jgi:putative transposase